MLLTEYDIPEGTWWHKPEIAFATGAKAQIKKMVECLKENYWECHECPCVVGFSFEQWQSLLEEVK